MMARRMIGRKVTVWDGVMLNRLFAHPHWNTATSAPKAAKTDSRNPRMDVIGTRMVRKARVSRRNARPTTTIRKMGRALDSFAEVSMFAAVVPPTRTCTPVWAAMAGSSWRILVTSVEVADAFGPVLGMTWMIAVWFADTKADAAITPGSCWSRDTIRVMSCGLDAVLR